MFTSGGTEANNLILLGAAAARPDRPRLAIGAAEHPSVAGVVERLPGRVEVWGVDAGGRLRDPGPISAETALVSTMLVNNETGVVQPLEAVVAAVRKAGAWVHIDGAFGL